MRRGRPADGLCYGAGTGEHGGDFGAWRRSICNVEDGHNICPLQRPQTTREVLKQRMAATTFTVLKCCATSTKLPSSSSLRPHRPYISHCRFLPPGYKPILTRSLPTAMIARVCLILLLLRFTAADRLFTSFFSGFFYFLFGTHKRMHIHTLYAHWLIQALAGLAPPSLPRGGSGGGLAPPSPSAEIPPKLEM